MKLRYDMVNCYVVRPGASADTHELLQLRRAPGDFAASMWAIVRGKIEGSETAWQTALRELAEETSLTPIEFYQLDTIDLFYLAADDSLWHCPGFVAIVSRDDVVTLNEEHDAIRWVARADATRDFLWPGERAQVAELCREILDDGPAKPHLRLAPPLPTAAPAP